MKEYLFFQNHKKHLPASQLAKSGMIPAPKDQEEDLKQTGMMKTGADFRQMFTTKKQQDDKEKAVKKALTVFSEQTMQSPYDAISSKYEDQYLAAGFPPKICSDMVVQLCSMNRMKCQVLDVGCGKGYVAGYLKGEGFHNVSGVDCSANLVEIARQKNQYSHTQRMVFGQPDYEIDESFKEKFDFVVCPSMINNNGYDRKVFLDMLYCLQVGGFCIFATKLNYFKQDIYEDEIKRLTEEKYWMFTSEHQFFRYDMLCEGMGKFSTKEVKVYAYQKLDYETMFEEQAKAAEEERLRKEAEAKANKGKKKKKAEEEENKE